MPEFDPTIPMGVTSPQAAQQVNPLGVMTGLADAQLRMTEAQNLRMTLGAKAKAGAIMANAPDLDSGIHALVQDPEVSGFVPDIINTLQAVSQSQLAMQGARQEQATSGLTSVFTGLLGALKDPSTFDADIATRMPTLSPSAQRAVTAALPGIKASLFDGLSSDPTVANEQYKQRLAALLIGTPIGADGVRAITGTMAPTMTTVTGPQGQPMSGVAGGSVTGQPSFTPLAVGPTTEKAAEMASEGGVVGGIESDMATAGADFPGMISTIKQATKVMDMMQTGGGADFRANLGKALQFFKNAGASGITDDFINQVANGDLKSSQALQAMLRNFVTGQLREASSGTGAGRIKSEVDAYLKSADVTTDPGALRLLFNAALQRMQIDYDMSQEYPKYKKALQDPNSIESLYGPAGFYSWYDANKLNLGELPAVTPGGQSLTVPPEQAKPGGTDLKSILGVP